MTTVEALLATVRVEDPRFRVERLPPGPAPVPVGERWALVSVARGRLGLDDLTLGPGDALLAHGRRSRAGRVDEDATLVVAEFALPQAAARLVVPTGDILAPADSELCRLLVERLVEKVDAGPGYDAVPARMLDWLVAETVRDALVDAPRSGTVADPLVSAALAAIHDDPAWPWTVDRLARLTGVSRAAFARRFREVVGTAPLSYVREHRLALAERALLSEPDATVAGVARRVGYASPFSFSTAFRRYRGVAPSELRPSSTAQRACQSQNSTPWSSAQSAVRP